MSQSWKNKLQAAHRQTAPYRRRESLKKTAAEKKRPGRPVGHEGQCRPQPPQIDQAVEIPLSAVQKADNVRFYALQKAGAELLRSLKSALSDATKAGDFDAAAKLKEMVTAAESVTVRQKPKDTIKAGGHEYAIIKDMLSFHRARKRCEEMGGHLVTLESAQEQQFIRQHAHRAKFAAWIGATNEDEHAQWKWVTGDPVAAEQARGWKHDNYTANIHAHGMTWWPDSDSFNDDNLGSRMGFICEWDK